MCGKQHAGDIGNHKDNVFNESLPNNILLLEAVEPPVSHTHTHTLISPYLPTHTRTHFIL